MRNNLASGNELTMIVSARAILSYLQLAPRNHEDWTQARVQRMPSNGCEFSRWLNHATRNELGSVETLCNDYFQEVRNRNACTVEQTYIQIALFGPLG